MPLQMSLLVIIISNNICELERLVYLLCLPSVILFTLYLTILQMTSYLPGIICKVNTIKTNQSRHHVISLYLLFNCKRVKKGNMEHEKQMCLVLSSFTITFVFHAPCFPFLHVYN